MEICDLCTKQIACTVADPMVHTSLGKHHYECSRRAWAAESKSVYVPGAKRSPVIQVEDESTRKCGNCTQIGHTARTCPYTPENILAAMKADEEDESVEED